MTSRRAGPASIALAAMLLAAPATARGQVPVASDVTVKAALLYNFAKFTEWPALPAGGPINLCVTGDEQIAAALVGIVRGHQIAGHALAVVRPHNSTSWRGCHVLFIASGDAQLWANAMTAIKTLPILTVSDRKAFLEWGGVIELYPESGRMRFAIGLDAVERSGLRLSSRLLALAKVVRSADIP